MEFFENKFLFSGETFVGEEQPPFAGGLSKSTPLRPGRDLTSYVTRYGCACVRIAVTRDGCACEKGFGFSVYGLVITVLMIFLMEKSQSGLLFP